jgi:splicing factor 1
MGLGSHFEHNHGKEIDHSNVYVGYLPPTMEEEQLIKLFSSFGRIAEAKVIRDHVNGSSKVTVL